MNKRISLSPFGEIKEDLFWWLKEYLVYKLQTLFSESAAATTIDDIIDLKTRLQEAEDIQLVKNVCNEAIQGNLKSMTKPLNGATRFYLFAIDYALSLKSFNDQTILDFKSSMDLAQSTIKNYVDVATELLTFIENKNAEQFKFGITYDEVRPKKAKRKVRDAMSTEEFARFNKEIERYPFENDLMKARDVLIVRLILLAGLKPSEIVDLKDGYSIVHKDKELYVKPITRSLRFDLPRKHFIRQINKYAELKEKNRDGYFFYDIKKKNTKLNTTYIQALVKRLLDFTKINRRESDAEMLRTSLAVWLYNHRSKDRQISLKTIQDIMGFDRVSKVKEMIKFHDDEVATVTDIFEKDLEL